MSPDPAYRRYLNELLTSAGHAICPADAPTSGSQPTAILFDADPWDEARADRLRSLLQRHTTAITIALMSLPHPEYEAAIIALGVNAVLPKLGDQASILNAMLHAAA
jgi:DNA-binding NarL/FixJ family response regulator